MRERKGFYPLFQRHHCHHRKWHEHSARSHQCKLQGFLHLLKEKEWPVKQCGGKQWQPLQERERERVKEKEKVGFVDLRVSGKWEGKRGTYGGRGVWWTYRCSSFWTNNYYCQSNLASFHFLPSLSIIPYLFYFLLFIYFFLFNCFKFFFFFFFLCKECFGHPINLCTMNWYACASHMIKLLERQVEAPHDDASWSWKDMGKIWREIGKDPSSFHTKTMIVHDLHNTSKVQSLLAYLITKRSLTTNFCPSPFKFTTGQPFHLNPLPWKT